jgi:UDP-glucose 4-epimerase
LKIVITGASGFLGRHILKKLNVYKRINVIPVTRQNIPGWCCVRSYSESPSANVLIHLAENNNPKNVEDEGKKYEQEVLNNLSTLLDKGYERVVYASSSLLYGDKDFISHHTNEFIQPYNQYTRIKFLSEALILKLPEGVVARLANVYGPGMSKSNVISQIIQQACGNTNIKILNKDPIRDFVWVDDVANAFISMALFDFKRVKDKPLFNIGTGVGTSIHELIALILESLGQPQKKVFSKKLPSQYPSSLILDISKTIQILEWQPETPLYKGLGMLLSELKKG